MTVIIFLMLAGCTGGSGKSLATWSGGKITEQDLKALLLINPALGDRLFQEPTRSLAINDLINRELLFQEAKNRGLDRTVELKKKREWVSKSLAIQGLIEQEADLKAHKYFEENKETFKDKSYDEAKEELGMRFRREASQTLAESLRAKANVQLAGKEPEAAATLAVPEDAYGTPPADTYATPPPAPAAPPSKKSR